jgi:hypothetical protein
LVDSPADSLFDVLVEAYHPFENDMRGSKILYVFATQARRTLVKAWVLSALLAGFPVHGGSRPRTLPAQHAASDSAEQHDDRLNQSRESNELSSVASVLAADGERVFALRADNTLLAFGASGALPVEIRLASPSPTVPMFAEHLLATNVNQSILFALVMSDAQLHQFVAVVDAAEVKLLRLIPVADGANFRCIAIGARTGHIYLSGNQVRKSPTPRKPPANPTVGNPVVWVLDPNDGMVLHTWNLDVPDEYDWWVYQAEPSEDEKNILVSYHGATTTGIDSFGIVEDELVRCKDRKTPHSGCMSVHGGFVQMRDLLFTTTGQPEILEYRSGTVEQVFNSELEGSHLMEFAIDRGRERIYAIGSCGFAGGLSVLKLNNGGQNAKLNADGWSWELLRNPAPKPQILIRKQEMCGERIAVGSGSVIVIAQTHGPEPLDTPGALLFLEGESGRLISRFTSSSRLIGAVVVHVGIGKSGLSHR